MSTKECSGFFKFRLGRELFAKINLFSQKPGLPMAQDLNKI